MVTWYVDQNVGSGSNNFAGDSAGASATTPDLTHSDGVANGTTTFTSALGGFTGLTGRKINIVTKGLFTIRVVNSDTNITLGNIKNTGTSTCSAGTSLTYNVGGRWANWTNIASANVSNGETIRFAGSPAPTLVGNSLWTSAIAATTPSKNIVTTTNTNIQCTAHGRSTGDTVYISGVTTNTGVNGTWKITRVDANNFTLDNCLAATTSGAVGTVKDAIQTVVQIPSTVTQHIEKGWRTWTNDSASCTNALDTASRKFGPSSVAFTIAAAAPTNTLMAHIATGTLDLSGYQQVNLFFRSPSASFVSNNFSIVLCTDTAATTVVHTIPIPGNTTSNFNNPMWPVTVDFGAPLNSSIKSIGLMTGSVSPAAMTININHVFASKASSLDDSLTLFSLIGKNNWAYDGWYGIRAIDGTNVLLDISTQSFESFQVKGYYGQNGVTETVPTYKRETIKGNRVNSSGGGSGPGIAAPQGGAAGLPLYYEGGWDIPTMSVQNTETWYDGTIGGGTAINFNTSYISLNLFGIVRYNAATFCASGTVGNIINTMSASNCQTGFTFGGNTVSDASITVGTLKVWACGTSILPFTTSRCTIATAIVDSNVNVGVNFSSCNGTNISNIISASNNGTIGNGTTTAAFFFSGATNSGVSTSVGDVRYNLTAVLDASATCSAGCYLNGGTMQSNNNSLSFTQGVSAFKMNNTTVQNNLAQAFDLTCATDCEFRNITTSGNTTATAIIGQGKNYFYSSTFGEATFGTVNTAYRTNAAIFSNKHQGVAGAVLIAYNGANAGTTTAIRHTASGNAWYIAPVATYRDSTFPVELEVGRYFVKANLPITITLWFYRDNITTLTGKLLIKGKYINGIAADVVSTTSGLINTWEQLSISATPTQDGVIKVYVQCYDGTNVNKTMYIDDIAFAQAGAVIGQFGSLDYIADGQPFATNEAYISPNRGLLLGGGM